MADYVVFLSFPMADDKDREIPEQRHQANKVASSRCGNRLLSVFTTSEKQHLVAQSFRDWELNHVDFSGADLTRNQIRKHVSSGLRFFESRSPLRGLYRCDLRRANFDNAIFGYNRFEKSCLIDATGIPKRLRSDITAAGGSFWYC